MLQSGARWGGVGHRYGHNCETRPSQGDRGSLRRDDTFHMNLKAGRNSPEEEGERYSRQSFWVLYRKAGWRVES